MTEMPPPGPGGPASLAALEAAVAKVDALVTAVEALTTEVAKQSDFRKRSAWAGLLIVALSAGGFAITAYKVTESTRVSTCTATNTTNRVLLDLVEQADAASPTDPPASASTEEIIEFRRQQTQSKQLVESIHRRLAPKEC